MTHPPLLHRARTALSLAAAALLAACAATAPEPTPPPNGRAVEDFSAGLRCMDDLLLDHGVRELPLAVSEPPDSGGRQSVVPRDLLQSTFNAMSKRSRALRVTVAGTAAQGGAGTVVQGVVQRPDAATRAVTLGLLSARDRSVLPDAAATQRATLHGDVAQIRSFGQSFIVPARGGDAQAVRAAVEAAGIQLVGRLTRVPYWSCLGAEAEHPEVEAEIRDWYDNLAARPKDLIGWFQNQLRVRGVYGGPADGVVNAQTKEAVARYREALGLSREPKLTHDFLRAYLRADHRQIAARTAAAPAPASTAQAPAPAPVPTPAPAPAPAVAKAAPPAAPAVAVAAAAPVASPLALRVATPNDALRFGRGERIALDLRPSRDAYVYCFHQDEHRQVRRFFPNRFQADARVNAAAGLQLPGAMRFELRMNALGAKESVSCFATERDVLATLPANMVAADFTPLPVSLEQLREAFVRASAGTMAHELLALQPR
jgi:peptidoglycan hydrolase-like protein with peptidoglycan-binding domain